MTEDKMVGCHHWLDGHEFEQAPGVGDAQGSLASSSPHGHKESDTTEQLNSTELTIISYKRKTNRVIFLKLVLICCFAFVFVFDIYP